MEKRNPKRELEQMVGKEAADRYVKQAMEIYNEEFAHLTPAEVEANYARAMGGAVPQS